MLYFARWKVTLILFAVVLGIAFASPNLLSEKGRADIPGFLPHNAINLGLDLQGGSYLLLEVDIDAVVAERLTNARSDATRLLREAEIRTANVEVTDTAVRVRLTNAENAERAVEALSPLDQPLSNALGAPRTFAINASGPDITITIPDATAEATERRIVAESIEIVRRRIDALGTSEPVIQRQGRDKIIVQAPGVDDPERLKEQIGQTAKMTFHIVRSDDPQEIQRVIETGRVPPRQRLIYQAPPEDATVAIQPPILIEERPRLSGEDLDRAFQGLHPEVASRPVVNFRFNTSASAQFCSLTTEFRGQRFAVVLDDEYITAPNINSPICQGNGFIEGGFTFESASDLAGLLNAGALPAPLTIVEERTVSSTLGADSVRAGRNALIIGFIGVVVFMTLAYGLFGVFSNLALLTNVILIAGALSGLQATLTLPGIAGIILTIGMAVDANVLIYERIREELRAGRTPANAVEAGYSRAFSAILDANVTTLIAALILIQVGSGPVRGFAVTLAIGILTSVFTAFVLSRFLVSLWFKTARPKALAI